MPDPKEDIRHLYKFLKQGGIVLIEVPNIETWTMRILRSKHRHFTQDHINFFSIKTLRQFLNDSGLKVIDHYNTTRHMSFGHLFEAWIKKYLPSSIGNFIQDTIGNSSLWKLTVNINFGDILTVIAIKP